jgi:hypothetical protein
MRVAGKCRLRHRIALQGASLRKPEGHSEEEAL